MPAETAARYVRYGAISAMIAVAAGAFGAHALRARLAPDLLEVFETAARYQMFHALALIAVGLLHDRHPHRALLWAARLFLAGTVAFAGSLYLLALTDTRWLGAIAPLGGAALIAGWGCFAFGASSKDSRGF